MSTMQETPAVTINTQGRVRFAALLLGALLLLISTPEVKAEEIAEERMVSAAEVHEIWVGGRQGNWGIVLVDRLDTRLFVTRGDGDNVTIRLTGDFKTNRDRCSPELEVVHQNGRLTVRTTSCGGPVFFLSSEGSLSLEIAVPRDWSGDIDIDASRMDVLVENAHFEKFRADVSSGTLELREVEAQEINVRSSSAPITVSDLVADRLSLRASSGDLHVEKVTAGVSSFETSSGSVLVYIREEASLDLQIETSSGDLRVDVPVMVNSSLDDDEFSGSVGEGGPMLQVETRSGDIHIATQ